ncbi:unnamed protein product [Acanthosepion pharaonis]|uniref:Uncharacterized protein n=1 Tax=Acanthosepion pharaonis TaxID=158019 RepID=A0A812E832_ACAPH|nr:unnamed protein product [Sepia pharaonis]
MSKRRGRSVDQAVGKPTYSCITAFNSPLHLPPPTNFKLSSFPYFPSLSLPLHCFTSSSSSFQIIFHFSSSFILLTCLLIYCFLPCFPSSLASFLLIILNCHLSFFLQSIYLSPFSLSSPFTNLHLIPPSYYSHNPHIIFSFLSTISVYLFHFSFSFFSFLCFLVLFYFIGSFFLISQSPHLFSLSLSLSLSLRLFSVFSFHLFFLV